MGENLTDALVRAQADSSGWGLQCVSRLTSLTGIQAQDYGFVDEWGAYMHTFDPVKTWGINYTACERFCGRQQITWPDFNFAGFANSFTNWLLPWLALIAQLPYSTGSVEGDLESLFLCIGSPALAAYSLFLSLTNRYNLRRRFDVLAEKASDELIADRWPNIRQHLKHVWLFLQEAQQVPLRLSQREGWLSSLIVCGSNHSWWQQIAKSLHNTKRHFTYSFWAQMLAAIAAWALTVAGAIASSLGNESVALELSASNVWVWMLPLVAGWLIAGIQLHDNSIDEVLKLSGTRRALEQQEDESTYSVKARQNGILVRSGFAPLLLPQRQQTSGTLSSVDITPAPSWYGMSLAGDEGRRGPIFNYARLFTWNSVADEIYRGLKKTLHNVRAGTPCQVGVPMQMFTARLRLEDSELRPEMVPMTRHRAAVGSFSTYAETTATEDIPLAPLASRRVPERRTGANEPKWDQRLTAKDNLAGDAYHTALYCGLEPHEPRNGQPYRAMRAYIPWHETTPSIWWSMLLASLFAVFVQWGTVGSSILLAYTTPTKGLSCRSGSYLVYAATGTLVWLLLTGSMLLSHAVLLHLQEEQISETGSLYSDDSSTKGNGMLELSDGVAGEKKVLSSTGWRFQVLCGLAVGSRMLGKALAICNGIWLVFASCFELIGFFDTCWCESVYAQHGMDGWVTIFKTNTELIAVTQGNWSAGIVMGTISWVLPLVIVILVWKASRIHLD